MTALRPADLVLRGGAVHTVDPARPRAQAVAVRGGRIVAVGTDADVGEHMGPRTRVVELRGRTLLPGFQDAHVHAVTAGPDRPPPARPGRRPHGARRRRPAAGDPARGSHRARRTAYPPADRGGVARLGAPRPGRAAPTGHHRLAGDERLRDGPGGVSDPGGTGRTDRARRGRPALAAPRRAGAARRVRRPARPAPRGAPASGPPEDPARRRARELHGGDARALPRRPRGAG